jgi:hypothetical protein
MATFLKPASLSVCPNNGGNDERASLQGSQVGKRVTEKTIETKGSNACFRERIAVAERCMPGALRP